MGLRGCLLARPPMHDLLAEDIEGYVFDGADGSQVALWTAHADRVSIEHAHDFDEYVLVIAGRCVVILGSERIELRAGHEIVIPKGTRQSMAVAAGTRTMHVFGGKPTSWGASRASPPRS
jgi:quercetin dioxygenase-like cupin family protein